MIEPIFILDGLERWRPVPVEESLDLYGRYSWTPGGWAQNNQTVERLNFPPDMKQPDLPLVGYHQTVTAAGLFWQQFWLWYLYNPWEIAGVGKHEGDWEFVQIATLDVEGNKPILLTASQHHHGGKREFWAHELRDSRPVIYVARGSHANYFTPGVVNPGDQCNGKGAILDSIEWRQFGRWALWPGRWGNSTGEGQSPQSPGRQGNRWRSPQTFHAEATAQ